MGADVVARLDRREAALLERLDLGGLRRVQWVGGRLAAAVAGRHVGQGKGEAFWVSVGPSGEPLPPAGFAVSISHKRTLAVALVARVPDVDPPTLGVDLEDDVDAARRAADLVLGPDERRDFDALPAGDGDRAHVMAFALKEATYKAIRTGVGRALAYEDARVVVSPAGVASIAMRRRGPERLPQLETSCEWRGRQVIAAVRAAARSLW